MIPSSAVESSRMNGKNNDDKASRMLKPEKK
jgi:hypothetical protein